MKIIWKHTMNYSNSGNQMALQKRYQKNRFRNIVIISLIDLLPNYLVVRRRFAIFCRFNQVNWICILKLMFQCLIHQTLPLLLRFRLAVLGVFADIKQAFIQISVRIEDTDESRLLWREDDNHTKLKYYRLCRVAFGIYSSPLLLNITIKYRLELQKLLTQNL